MPAKIKKLKKDARGRVRWRAVAVVGRGPDGRAVHKTGTFDTRREAEAARARWLTQAADGALVVRRRNGRTLEDGELTLARFLDAWLASPALAEAVRGSTIDDYTSQVETYVKPYLGGVPLHGLTRKHVEDWVETLRRPKVDGGRGIARSTTRHALTVLHIAIESACEGERPLLRENVARLNARRRQALRKEGQVERPVLDPDGARRYRETVTGAEHEALLLTLLDTGVRPSEALGLRWEDLHDDRLAVRRALVDRGPDRGKLLPPKTRKSRRSIDLPLELVAALKRHRAVQLERRLRAGSAWRDDDLMFCDAIGRVLKHGVVRAAHKNALRRAKLPDMRVYDLRHTHATLLLKAGVNPKIVSERLGHSSTTLTMDLYSHVLPTMQAEAVRAYELLLG